MKYLPSTLSVAAACLLSISLSAQTKPVDLYVGVVDAKGEPASGLQAADFQVREDGTAREVLKAGEATEPLTVALLVDDSQAMSPALQMVREAVDGFIAALAGKAEIAVTTFGDRPEILVDYTTDQKKLLNGAHRIFPRPGSGAYLMDALVEVSKGFQKREAKRPVIVVLAMDNETEFSNRHYQEVLAAIDKSRAPLHVITLGMPNASLTDEMRNRNTVIADGTARSGGRRDNVLALTGAAPRMKQLANELLHQYVVTYARPETLIPPDKIEVTVKNPALTVHARTRSAQAGAR
jgi:Ca-activated chloride channel family protein